MLPSLFTKKIAALAFCFGALFATGGVLSETALHKTPVEHDMFVVHADVKRLRARMQKGDFAGARTWALSRYRATKNADFLWLAARCAQKLEQFDQAALDFAKLGALENALKPWAHLLEADLSIAASPARSISLTKRLMSDAWPGAGRAKLVYVRALTKQRRVEEALPVIRDVVQKRYASTPVDTLNALAEALELSSAPSDREEAIEVWRWISVRKPKTPLAMRAEVRVQALLDAAPKEVRARVRARDDEFAFERAQSLFNSGDWSSAAKEFDAIARTAGLPSERGCEARFMQARALFSKKARQEGIPLMQQVITRCKDDDLKTRARFLKAQALANVDDNTQAIDDYTSLSHDATQHRLADDALFKTAMLLVSEKRPVEARAALERLINDHPSGDMLEQARFQLAWLARSEKDFARALELFEQLSNQASAPAEDTSGRYAYWRARVLSELGRKSEAAEGYRRVMQTVPLSYYAQQAYVQLLTLDANGAKVALEGWRPLRHAKAIAVTTKEYPKDAWFERAVALMRVGESDYANEELRFGKWLENSQDAVQVERVAKLYYHFELYPQLVSWMRKQRSLLFTEVASKPTPLWTLAYPNAYAPLIEQLSKKASIPAAFVRAIAREESSFDANAVSNAGAHGLIQLIAPTAKRWGSEIKVPYSVDALHVPENNLRIGVRFMQELWRQWGANPGVIPSGYNAGPIATQRWLSERPDEPLDVWIENIPYEETRRYTRRVLQSYGIYSWLGEGTLPSLSKSAAGR